MSANETAPQDERDVDLAAALGVDDADAGDGDTGAPRPARSDDDAPSSGAPEATPQQEQQSDDDDPALAVEERIARAERRSAKQTQGAVQAAREEAERAKRQAATYKGLVGTKEREAKRYEAELAEAKRLATDVDAQRNKQWEDLIGTQTDPETRAYYRREYELEKRERAAEATARDAEARAKQAEEAATHERTERRSVAETQARDAAISDIETAIPRAAADMGLPQSEYRDLLAWLGSPEVRLNAARLPLVSDDPNEPTLTHYHQYLLVRADQELTRRAQAHQERQAATNRDKARGVYRGDLPVGGGGGRKAPTTLEEAGDELVRRLTAR